MNVKYFILNIVVFLFLLSNHNVYAQEYLLPVKKDGLWGYINGDGEVKITPKYSYASRYYDWKYAVVKSDKFKLIDTEGNNIQGIEGDTIIIYSPQYFVTTNNNVYTLYSTSGYKQIVSDCSLIDIYFEYFKIYKNGLCAIIDGSGNEVFPYKFQKVKLLTRTEETKLFLVSSNDKTGLYCEKKGVLLDTIYDAIGHYSSDKLYMYKDNKKSFYSLTERRIIAEGYDDLNFLNSVYVVGTKDSTNILFNVKTDEVIISGYDYYYLPWKQSSVPYFIVARNDSIGAITADGHKALPTIYEELIYLGDKLFRVKSGDLYGVIDVEGNTLVQFLYEDIYPYKASQSPDYFIIKKERKCGLIDNNGVIKVPPEFDGIAVEATNFFITKKGDKIGLYGKTKELFKPELNYISITGNFALAYNGNFYNMASVNEVVSRFVNLEIIFSDNAAKLYRQGEIEIIEFDTRGNILDRFVYDNISSLKIAKSNYTYLKNLRSNYFDSRFNWTYYKTSDFYWKFSQAHNKWGVKKYGQEGWTSEPAFQNTNDTEIKFYKKNASSLIKPVIYNISRIKKQSNIVRSQWNGYSYGKPFEYERFNIKLYSSAYVATANFKATYAKEQIGSEKLLSLSLYNSTQVYIKFSEEYYNKMGELIFRHKTKEASKLAYLNTTFDAEAWIKDSRSMQVLMTDSLPFHVSGNKWGYKKIYSYYNDVISDYTLENEYRLAGFVTPVFWEFLRTFFYRSGYRQYYDILPFRSDNDTMYVCSEKNILYGVIDKKGEYFIRTKYEKIKNCGTNLFACLDGRYWTVLNTDAEVVCDSLQDAKHAGHNDIFVAKKDGKWAYISSTGDTLTKFQFDEAHPFSEDRARVRIDTKYGYIDPKGETVIPLEFKKAHDFKSGIAITKRKIYWGCIDKQGDVTIDFKLKTMPEFINNFAEIKLNTAYGIINENGEVVLEGKYKKGMIITKKGKAFVPVMRKEKGLFSFLKKKEKKYLVYDINNKTWDEEKSYDRIYKPASGLILFKKNKKYGYMNEDGEIEIKAEFRIAKSFYQNRAAVKVKSSWMFIDTKGKFISNDKHTEYTDFQNGIAKVGDRNRQCLIDSTGEKIMTVKFNQDFIGKSSAGNILVGSYSNSNYYTPEGKLLVGEEVEKATPFCNGKAFVKVGEKYAMINEKGKYTTDFVFSSIEENGEEYAIVTHNSGTGVLDERGKEILPFIYDKAYPVAPRIIRADKNGFISYQTRSGIEIWPLTK